MTELAKKFIGKKCIIYSLNDNQITGVIKEVSDGALLIENDGNLQAVNLDFIVRIREHQLLLLKCLNNIYQNSLYSIHQAFSLNQTLAGINDNLDY